MAVPDPIPCPFCGQRARAVKVVGLPAWKIGCVTHNWRYDLGCDQLCPGNRNRQNVQNAYPCRKLAVGAWNSRRFPANGKERHGQ